MAPLLTHYACFIYITALIFNNKKMSRVTITHHPERIYCWNCWKSKLSLKNWKSGTPSCEKCLKKLARLEPEEYCEDNKNWKHFSTGTSCELLEAQAPCLFQSLQTVTSLSWVLFLDLHLCITSLVPLTLATVVAEEPQNGHLGAICCQSRLARKGHELG